MTTLVILNEDFKPIGTAEFSAEEVEHFTNTGSAAAKVMLDAGTIARLGIDEDDYVYAREQ